MPHTQYEHLLAEAADFQCAIDRTDVSYQAWLDKAYDLLDEGFEIVAVFTMHHTEHDYLTRVLYFSTKETGLSELAAEGYPYELELMRLLAADPTTVVLRFGDW